MITLKNIAGLIVFSLGFLSLSAQKTTVNGKILNNTYEKMVFFKIQSDTLTPIDSIVISKNGAFTKEINLQGPDLLLVKFEPSEKNYQNWILHPKEKIYLEYSNTDGLLHLSQTKGSKEMEFLKQFMDTEQTSVSKLNEYRSQYEKAGEDEKQHIAQRFNAEVSTLKNSIKALILTNKNLLGAVFAVNFFSQEMEEYAALFNEVSIEASKNYPTHPLVKDLEAKLLGSLLPGSKAPDIALPDQNGNIRMLSSLKGKVVLIDFWASWCKPCRMENPNVVKLYETYKDKGFSIFSVSLDNNKQGWESAIVTDNLKWDDHVSDLKGWNSDGAALYGVRSIPFTVLIDREGNVISTNLRGEALKQKLVELFNN